MTPRYILFNLDGTTKGLKRLSNAAQLQVNFGDALVYDSLERKVFGPSLNTYASMDDAKKRQLQALRARIKEERGL